MHLVFVPLEIRKTLSLTIVNWGPPVVRHYSDPGEHVLYILQNGHGHLFSCYCIGGVGIYLTPRLSIVMNLGASENNKIPANPNIKAICSLVIYKTHQFLMLIIVNLNSLCSRFEKLA